MADDIRSFEEFWPHYVRAHSDKRNRNLHFVGTTAAMALMAAGILTRRKWLMLMAPVAGYGFAWFGHFVLEGNKPATFGHPLWSLQGDFKMWSLILHGKMDAEVDRIVRQHTEEAEAAAARASHEAVGDPSVN